MRTLQVISPRMTAPRSLLANTTAPPARQATGWPSASMCLICSP